jgi:DnaJ family protein B protein 4
LKPLCGWERTISTIDSKKIKIDKLGPTQPGSSDTYPDLGMPLSKMPGRRSRFIVTYQVKYPTTLSLSQKEKIRHAMLNSSTGYG